MKKFLAKSLILMLTVPVGVGLKGMDVNAATYNKADSTIVVAKASPTKEGFYKNSDGTMTVYKNGKVDTSANGLLFNSKDSKWYMVQNGRVDNKYEGICQNKYGKWAVKKSTVDFGYNGLFFDSHQRKWYNVEAGKVKTGETFKENNSGVWYVGKDGTVDFSKNGVVVIGRFKINVVKGQVTCLELLSTYNGSLKQPYSGPCAAFAYVLGINYVTGATHSYTEVYSRSLGCLWNLGHVESMATGKTEREYCNEIYNSLLKGKPVIINYEYGNGHEHWVCIMGIKNVKNRKNLHYSDFFCVDSVYGRERTLTDAWGFNDNSRVYGIKKVY